MHASVVGPVGFGASGNGSHGLHRDGCIRTLATAKECTHRRECRNALDGVLGELERNVCPALPLSALDVLCTLAMSLFELTEECRNAALGKWPGIEPGSKRKDRPTSIPVFKNPFVEKYLARAHWVTPGIWFGPLVIYGLYRGFTGVRTGVLGTVGLYLCGILIWTLAEYVLHRFVFHTLPITPKTVRNYLVHQYHHDFPDDRYRLVMVPMGSWPLGALWGTAYYFLFGPSYFWPILAGSATGYIAYDWIHYYTHHARPRTALGKWLRSYHLQHHHDDPLSRFGVSSPLWDFVFGTYKPLKKATPASAVR